MHPLADLLYHLIDPLHFMFLSFLYLPGTILSLIRSGDSSALLSPSAIKDAWFARFWADYGPGAREGASLNALPLIKEAYGVVLEVGPGNGEWIRHYDTSKVTKIYGVEPNKDHHAALKRKVIEAGLSDVYVLCGVGVEDLGKEWVTRGEVDCVVTIQCLCSVPSPREMISHLYGYLKPGGQWIVYEHVITKKNFWISTYQKMVDLIWPIFLGGCSITRDTEKWLRDAGTWSKIDLKQPEGEPIYQVIPHLKGLLKK